MKLDDILVKLENDGKILDFRFEKNKTPMYLLMRSHLIQLLINREFKLSNPHVKESKRSIKKILLYIYHTLKTNLFFSPKKDIYIFSSGIVNRLENDIYVNRLYDEFYQLYKNKTQIIESSVKFSYLLPKKEKVYFRDLIDIIIVLSSKVTKSKKEDIKEIENFIEYIKSKNLYGTNDKTFENIRTLLIRTSKRMNISFWLYRQFLKLKKPKLIIVEDAHYFGHYALIEEAKKLGIKTAEYQHGYVGLGHRSYNYHENIFTNIKAYLPEYLLTHGKHWNEVSRTPSQKIVIGLASLSNNIKNIKRSNIPSNKILFISGGTVYEELNRLIEKSLESLRNLGYEIILRPHPSELPEVNQRYSNLIAQGIKIDTSSLYDILKEIEVVVGMEVSTVLYEAVCFTNKVYMMNTKYTNYYEPKSVFIKFSDETTLVNSIKKSRVLEQDANYFWDSNWEKNYSNFIENMIGIKR